MKRLLLALSVLSVSAFADYCESHIRAYALLDASGDGIVRPIDELLTQSRLYKVLSKRSRGIAATAADIARFDANNDGIVSAHDSLLFINLVSGLRKRNFDSECLERMRAAAVLDSRVRLETVGVSNYSPAFDLNGDGQTNELDTAAFRQTYFPE